MVNFNLFGGNTMLIKLEDDKLERGKELEKLFNLFNRFGNQNGHGITMLINGKYGSGKTTILNFIEEKATNEKCSFNVIRLNIWEEKLFDNPLFSLLNKISALGEQSSTNTKDKSINKWGARVKETGWQLLQAFTKLDFKTIWMSHGDSNKGINLINEYKAYNNAIKEYKQALKQFCEDKKVVLLIDELDRCLPEYQIKTLEVLHHFFDIPNLIVVIAMDKSQLEYSIKNIFGESLDIIGYLNKFINYEIQLSQGSIVEYINSLLPKIDLPKNYKQDEFKKTMYNLLMRLDLSLRDMQQGVEEIALIYNKKLSKNELQVFQWVFYNANGKIFLDPTLIAFLVILKKYKQNFYQKYFKYQDREKNFYNNRIDLLSSNSIFKQFLEEIEKEIFNMPIKDIIMSMGDKYFLLNLINLICPISYIDSKSIENYFATLHDQYSISMGVPVEYLLMDVSNYLKRNGNEVRNAIIHRINLI